MKLYISFLTIFIFAVSAFAQTAKNQPGKKAETDFSGTWVLDKTKTKKADFDMTLIVEQREPEIFVTSNLEVKGVKKSVKQIYYTDARTLYNVREDSELATHEFSWAGDILIKETQRRRSAENLYGRIQEGIVEKWELSKDGQTLTLTRRELFLVNRPNLSNDINHSQDALEQGETAKVYKFKRGS